MLLRNGIKTNFAIFQKRAFFGKIMFLTNRNFHETKLHEIVQSIETGEKDETR
jgi:hypothetical protein